MGFENGFGLAFMGSMFQESALCPINAPKKVFYLFCEADALNRPYAKRIYGALLPDASFNEWAYAPASLSPYASRVGIFKLFKKGNKGQNDLS